jgi:farnesol dehydrogenase
MRILVTGATGYLGTAVVAAMAAHGHTVVALARTASAAGLPAAAFDADIRDEDAVLAAADGCEAICHLAALVNVWRPRRADFEEVNVGGLRTILRAASRHDIKRIVYTSSFMALPPTGATAPVMWNDYQRTKVLADRVAAEAVAGGAPLIRVYPGVVYGPGSLRESNLIGRMITDHLAGRLPGLIGAARRWSYAYIDDVAAGHVAALERGEAGGRYLFGGDNVPQMRIFEIVRDLTGVRLPHRIPFLAALAFAAYGEARAALTGTAPLLTVGTARILNRDWTMSSEVTCRQLGFRVTAVRDGVARVVAAIRKERLSAPSETADSARTRS